MSGPAMIEMAIKELTEARDVARDKAAALDGENSALHGKVHELERKLHEATSEHGRMVYGDTLREEIEDLTKARDAALDTTAALEEENLKLRKNLSLAKWSLACDLPELDGQKPGTIEHGIYALRVVAVQAAQRIAGLEHEIALLKIQLVNAKGETLRQRLRAPIKEQEPKITQVPSELQDLIDRGPHGTSRATWEPDTKAKLDALWAIIREMARLHVETAQVSCTQSVAELQSFLAEAEALWNPEP